MTTMKVTAALRVKAAYRVAHVLNDNGDARATAACLDALGWDSLAVGCVSEGARYRRVGEWAVYEWRDGSAIVEAPSGHWDIRAHDCTQTCWSGGGCQCWREETVGGDL